MNSDKFNTLTNFLDMKAQGSFSRERKQLLAFSFRWDIDEKGTFKLEINANLISDALISGIYHSFDVPKHSINMKYINRSHAFVWKKTLRHTHLLEQVKTNIHKYKIIKSDWRSSNYISCEIIPEQWFESIYKHKGRSIKTKIIKKWTKISRSS